MKKTFIMALAGLMLFAFTQCGGNGNKDNNEENTTKVTETPEVTEPVETSDISGTKQFTEVKQMYDEIEKMINDADDCEKLQEATMALLFGSLAVGLGGDQYEDDQKMTEKENEQIESIGNDLMEKAEKKSKEMGCDTGLGD